MERKPNILAFIATMSSLAVTLAVIAFMLVNYEQYLPNPDDQIYGLALFAGGGCAILIQLFSLLAENEKDTKAVEAKEQEVMQLLKEYKQGKE